MFRTTNQALLLTHILSYGRVTSETLPMFCFSRGWNGQWSHWPTGQFSRTFQSFFSQMDHHFDGLNMVKIVRTMRFLPPNWQRSGGLCQALMGAQTKSLGLGSFANIRSYQHLKISIAKIELYTLYIHCRSRRHAFVPKTLRPVDRPREISLWCQSLPELDAFFGRPKNPVT